MKKNLSNFLFIFLPFYRKFVIISNARAIDSVGRVPPSHGGSQGFESLIAHQRRGEAIFAKDCLSDGLFAFTLAAPFPKKFYNFLGSPF